MLVSTLWVPEVQVVAVFYVDPLLFKVSLATPEGNLEGVAACTHWLVKQASKELQTQLLGSTPEQQAEVKWQNLNL